MAVHRKPPPRLPDYGGIWTLDRSRGVHHFMSFDELHRTCQWLMDPNHSYYVEQRLGKMHYSKDPTYNMRKK